MWRPSLLSAGDQRVFGAAGRPVSQAIYSEIEKDFWYNKEIKVGSGRPYSHSSMNSLLT